MGLGDRLRELAPERPWIPRPEILASPGIPLPLWGQAPRRVMGQEWWDEVRRAAYVSTNFHCIACTVHRRQARGSDILEGHEVYRIDYPAGRMTYLETVPLCTYCHSYIHKGRLEALVNKGYVTFVEYLRIRGHGNKVLKEAGIPRPVPYTGPVARWGRWRMILDGVAYPPLYPNERAMRKAFKL